jgi:hypothetical protein
MPRSEPGLSGPAGNGQGRVTFTAPEVVEALYRGLLDRYPDPRGLRDNTDILETGADLWSLVHGIRHSPEASLGLLRSSDLAHLGRALWEGREQRRREPPLYFCHIMKTAGTSLVEAMTAVAGRRFCLTQIFLDHFVAIPELVLSQASLVSGHLGMEVLEYLPPETVTVSVLRDPVERTLSHYAHVLADPALAVEVEGLTLEEFISSPRWRPLAADFQARNLVQHIGLGGAWKAWSPLERLRELGPATPAADDLPVQSLFHHAGTGLEGAALLSGATRVMDGMELVGLTEDLDSFWFSLARLWGLSDPPAVPRSNARAHDRAGQLPASLRRHIEEANPVDLALYEVARARAPRPVRALRPAPAPQPASPPASVSRTDRRRGWVGALRDPGLAFGLALSLVASLVDTLDGSRLILIGSLAAGPCATLTSRRWLRTAVVAVIAVALSLVLAVPDGIWDTGTQAGMVASVAVIAAAAVALAWILERRTHQQLLRARAAQALSR